VSGKSIGNDARRIILSQLKSIGLVPGVWDFEFLYYGVLNFVEIKVGADKISPEQEVNMRIGIEHGARFFECRTEQEFIETIDYIVNGGIGGIQTLCTITQ
jgi:hypothetical protein